MLFTSFIDVLDDDLMVAEPVALAATAGTPWHARVSQRDPSDRGAVALALASSDRGSTSSVLRVPGAVRWAAIDPFAQSLPPTR